MVEPVAPPPERDPEFRPPINRSIADDDGRALEEYQRLVANPFLGLVGFLFWMVGIRLVLSRVGGPALLPSLFLLFAGAVWLPFLFHYHCLDCGSSGPLHRWRRHACSAVAERSRQGRRPLLRGPSPPIQVVLWLYLLLAFAIALNALGWSVGSWIP